MKTTETVYGKTPHRGVKSVAYYYDADRRPCEQKNARFMNIVEYDENDHRLFEVYGICETHSPIFGIRRLRMGIDGTGVTTLVTFMGCPLNCKYCLNNFCHRAVFQKDGVTPSKGVQLLSPQQLYNKVKIDDIYFQTTGGGICFGGGEPCMASEYIICFKNICRENHKPWKLTIETSLNVPRAMVEDLLLIIDHWIVDIKDMNPQIYESYTGKDNSQVIDNLKLLHERGAKLTVRVPLILDYNTDKDVDRSIKALHDIGITSIDKFNYIIKNQEV